MELQQHLVDEQAQLFAVVAGGVGEERDPAGLPADAAVDMAVQAGDVHVDYVEILDVVVHMFSGIIKRNSIQRRALLYIVICTVTL